MVELIGATVLLEVVCSSIVIDDSKLVAGAFVVPLLFNNSSTFLVVVIRLASGLMVVGRASLVVLLGFTVELNNSNGLSSLDIGGGVELARSGVFSPVLTFSSFSSFVMEVDAILDPMLAPNSKMGFAFGCEVILLVVKETDPAKGFGEVWGAMPMDRFSPVSLLAILFRGRKVVEFESSTNTTTVFGSFIIVSVALSLRSDEFATLSMLNLPGLAGVSVVCFDIGFMVVLLVISINLISALLLS